MGFFNDYATNATARPLTLNLPAVMRQVYLWMTLGLLATAATAYGVAHTGLPFALAQQPLLLLVVLIIEVGMVMFISARINRLDPATAAGLFLAYAVLNGVTLSYIFLVYNLGTITYAALPAGVMFGATSLVSYVTRIDLSKLGGILFMALIGLIVAMIINVFVGGSQLSQLISFVGVLIFVGLTAYDTQRIKNMAYQVAATSDFPEAALVQRMGVIGALTLYLDIINLFLFLLRLMGGRGGRR